MQRIGLLSDTHGYLDPRVFQFFADCDEVWHAGDFGTLEVAERLAEFKPLRGVFGNIDDQQLRESYPLDNRFECEQLDVWITHIGGYPGRYDRRVRPTIYQSPPGLFISGHSHVLRVMRDTKLGNLLHLNPGAAGKQGFHVLRTMMLFEVHGAEVKKLQAVDLGRR
jgi:putative phosphoesterase